MDCEEKLYLLLSELKKALKGSDKELRKEVERIVRRYYLRKRRKGDFELKAGNTYYLNDKSGKMAYKVLLQILNRGLPALCITRLNPESLQMKDYQNLEIYWLSSLPHKNAVARSDLTKIYSIIASFIKKNDKATILLDGAETIITNTDFRKTLNLLQRIRDLVSERKGIFVVPIDLNTLGEKERALFEREMMNEIPIKKSI
ncbi:MAG: DUF835 domain-containing protein [Thermoplasmata archaeon]|nr:DUF835 domain-containing protein [Thermoplasmata archaeon]